MTVRSWFGDDRLLCGSDWPVCLLASSYEGVLTATRELFADLPESARAAVFGGNAIRVYGLKERLGLD